MNAQRTDIPRLGLTGGIGSGKSTALAYLHELGAAVISSDAVVHGLYSTAEIVAGSASTSATRSSTAQAASAGRRSPASSSTTSWSSAGWRTSSTRTSGRPSTSGRRPEQARPRPALLVVEVPLLFETGWPTGSTSSC